MADYVVLCKLTQAGAKAISQLPQSVQAGLDKATQQPNVKVIGSYLLFGSYDWIFLLEAPDDETIARAVLTLVADGLVTSETLRAFDPAACVKLFQGGG